MQEGPLRHDYGSEGRTPDRCARVVKSNDQKKAVTLKEYKRYQSMYETNLPKIQNAIT